MPIDWDTVPDGSTVGDEMVELMRELFPLPRSLSGDGVRRTLDVLGRDLPLDVIETPSGVEVFDWTVPREWTIRGAWIDAPGGERILDFGESTLQVLGYSTPVDRVVGLDELRAHVFTHSEDADLVPYRTSYWEEQWGRRERPDRDRRAVGPLVLRGARGGAVAREPPAARGDLA